MADAAHGAPALPPPRRRCTVQVNISLTEGEAARLRALAASRGERPATLAGAMVAAAIDVHAPAVAP
jgi:hypothetical protein